MERLGRLGKLGTARKVRRARWGSLARAYGAEEVLGRGKSGDEEEAEEDGLNLREHPHRTGGRGVAEWFGIGGGGRVEEEEEGGVRVGGPAEEGGESERMVSDLQCEMVREENEITDELGEWQEAGACDLLLTISGVTDARVVWLAEAVKKADELRVRTVRRVVELLTPSQAAEFLGSVDEMEFGARGLGMKYSQLSATSS